MLKIDAYVLVSKGTDRVGGQINRNQYWEKRLWTENKHETRPGLQRTYAY